MNFGWSMFERSWLLMGMENVLTYMITNPNELEQFYDRNCEYLLKLVDIALEYDEIDGVLFGDDWGQQNGMIMGPRYWRQFIKPRMARLYERVKSKGRYTLQHCCGDVRDIFPDLIDIGLDCFQTFQPEIYDIAEMKRLYGNSITFWGGISTQRSLPWMTPEQVKQEIIRVVKIMRPNGGYILGPTHDVPYDVPPENILAMMEVCHNQDRYF
jgi:uroporphyrinogen decarboxylase